MLQGERDAHLNDERVMQDAGSIAPIQTTEPSSNKRNGFTQKTLKTEYEPLTLDIPRNRHSTFDPVLVPRHRRPFGKIDEQIITMYSRGMSTRDIRAFVCWANS